MAWRSSWQSWQSWQSWRRDRSHGHGSQSHHGTSKSRSKMSRAERSRSMAFALPKLDPKLGPQLEVVKFSEMMQKMILNDAENALMIQLYPSIINCHSVNAYHMCVSLDLCLLTIRPLLLAVCTAQANMGDSEDLGQSQFLSSGRAATIQTSPLQFAGNTCPIYNHL